MSQTSVLDRIASEQEDEPAYFSLLRERCYAEAVPLIRNAMARDDGHAMGLYGSLLAIGQGIEKNLDEAAAWFRQGAVRGDVFSQLAFGVCLASGRGIALDQQEAAYWLFKAGSAGQLEAISALSDIAGHNPSVIGPHFSLEQYLDLMTKLRRPDRVH